MIRTWKSSIWDPNFGAITADEVSWNREEEEEVCICLEAATKVLDLRYYIPDNPNWPEHQSPHFATQMASNKLTTIPESLESVQIKTLPSSAYYISEFITQEEERFLLEKVHFLGRRLTLRQSIDANRSRRLLNLDGSSFPKGACKLGLLISPTTRFSKALSLNGSETLL